MPVEKAVRERINAYCARDLPGREWYVERLLFVKDEELRKRLALEFEAARKIYKIGEALSVSGDDRHPFVKFQITQYASIYEAVINHMLWTHFADHGSVKKIQNTTDIRAASSGFSKDITVTGKDGDRLFLAGFAQVITPPRHVRFEFKVDAAVEIGFLDNSIGEEIKKFYELRNAIHLDAAARRSIRYEISQSKSAYERLQPFINGCAEFLQTGKLPESARPKPLSSEAA